MVSFAVKITHLLLIGGKCRKIFKEPVYGPAVKTFTGLWVKAARKRYIGFLPYRYAIGVCIWGILARLAGTATMAYYYQYKKNQCARSKWILHAIIFCSNVQYKCL
jgi:tryptophan-rich sensory protein